MKLIKYPNDLLKVVCIPVKDFNEELHSTLDQMQELMLRSDGRGLAANQCGLTQRIFIMKDLKGNIWEFINPEIIFKDDIQYETEGCLSFPGVNIEIQRAKQVSVKAYNRNGEEFSVGCIGIEAVCVQHEIDHLDGIQFIDHLSRQQKRFYLKKLKK